MYNEEEKNTFLIFYVGAGLCNNQEKKKWKKQAKLKFQPRQFMILA